MVELCLNRCCLVDDSSSRSVPGRIPRWHLAGAEKLFAVASEVKRPRLSKSYGKKGRMEGNSFLHEFKVCLSEEYLSIYSIVITNNTYHTTPLNATYPRF